MKTDFNQEVSVNTRLVESLLQIILSLSVEERQLLEERLHPGQSSSGQLNWQTNSFIGMWRDREEMQDSTQWVRAIRQQEW